MNNTFLGKTHVVDLSHHNGIVDFQDLAANGIIAAINKACDGAFNTDDRYLEHDRQARAAGIVPGAYIFVHPYQDPQKQADKLLATATTGTKLLALDIEWDLKNKVDLWTGQHMETGKKVLKPALDSAQARSDFLDRMIERIHFNTGFFPLIYTSFSFFDPTFGQPAVNSSLIRQCPAWVVDVSLRQQPRVPQAWKSAGWILRQCGIGRVGKESPVDLDVFNGTAEELRARFR